MKKIRIKDLLLILGMVAWMVACGDGSDVVEPSSGDDPAQDPPPTEEDYVAPAPPVDIDATKLFTVDFVSTLSDDSLFEGSDYSDVVDHITTQSGAVLHILDRSDMVIGERAPHTTIASENGWRGYFAPHSYGAGEIEGSAMVCNSLVDRVQGVYVKGSIMASGCRVTALLGVDVTLMTTTIDSTSQIDALFARFDSEMQSDMILLGRIESSQIASIDEHLKQNYENFRVYFDQSEGEYSLWALSPLSFVCRTITGSSIAEVPYYLFRFEKI